MNVEMIKNAYSEKKAAIEKRLSEFKEVWKQDDKRIFTELCFCLCVPQSSAKRSWAAISELVESGKLFAGSKDDVYSVVLKHGVRFPENKSNWILEARQKFSQKSLVNPRGEVIIKPLLKQYSDPQELREWLVKNIKGIGYKLAGHFMRNIGLYQEHAILDVHILKNLHRLGVIDQIPEAMSPKQYLEIERKFKQFSEEIEIPISHLDLIFWSNETGEIFK